MGGKKSFLQYPDPSTLIVPTFAYRFHSLSVTTIKGHIYYMI